MRATSSVRANLAHEGRRTFSPRNDHGDSIEVVTQESAWQVVDFVEATTDDAGEERVQERVQERVWREPEEREKGRHPIERDAKDDR